MIRINLLAQKREARKSGSVESRWAAIFVGALVLEVVVLAVVHQSKREELSAQKRTNAELTAQIEQMKKAIANHGDVKAQLEVLRAREDAIAKLQAARNGPSAVMLELAQLLTAGRGPTSYPDQLAQLRRDNPSSIYNPAWDSRRLWLSSLQEDHGLFKLEGLARDGDDVSELARRLGLSVYFGDVKLLPGARATDAESHIELVRFQLQAKARY